MVFKPGDLLIAPPGMLDPRFRKTVLIITYDGLHGTQALCLNRDTDLTVNNIIEPMGRALDPDQPLYWGGPVASTTLWMLHDRGWSTDNTLEINNSWSVTSSTRMFNDLENSAGPHRARFCLGLSSWAPGQLEAEIDGSKPWHPESSWLIAHCPPPDILFKVDPDDMWEWACELSAQQAVASWI